jgi:hypothetical protein
MRENKKNLLVLLRGFGHVLDGRVTFEFLRRKTLTILGEMDPATLAAAKALPAGESELQPSEDAPTDPPTGGEAAPPALPGPTNGAEEPADPLTAPIAAPPSDPAATAPSDPATPPPVDTPATPGA